MIDTEIFGTCALGSWLCGAWMSDTCVFDTWIFDSLDLTRTHMNICSSASWILYMLIFEYVMCQHFPL